MDALTIYIVKHYKNLGKKYNETRAKLNGIPSIILIWRAVNKYAHQKLKEVFESFLSQFWTYKLIGLQFTNVFPDGYTNHVLFTILPSRGVNMIQCPICFIYCMQKNTNTCKICGRSFCSTGLRFCGYRNVCHIHSQHLT